MLALFPNSSRMKVQKVQEVLCSGFLNVLRLSSLRSKYLSVYEKVRGTNNLLWNPYPSNTPRYESGMKVKEALFLSTS